MAKSEDRRWRGWRTAAPPTEIKGSQPRGRPHGKRRTKLHRWFWFRNKKPQDCPRCKEPINVGDLAAYSRPRKVLCKECIGRSALTPKTSKKLAEERRAAVIETLRKASK